ncbi:MAG: nucleoside 2-deoxyribosyltransferase [Bacteroidota bacterium]
MTNNEIYFAASISGGRQDVDIYLQLIEYLKNYGTVLTEHIGDKELSVKGEYQTDSFVHDRDMSWLSRAHIVVAEVTTASLGVGYELGRIVERNGQLREKDRKSILCLHRPSVNKRLSAMIAGCPGIINKEYQTFEDAIKYIDEFLVGM